MSRDEPSKRNLSSFSLSSSSPKQNNPKSKPFVSPNQYELLRILFSTPTVTDPLPIQDEVMVDSKSQPTENDHLIRKSL